MAVGSQATTGSINQTLTGLSVQMRDLMLQVGNLQQFVQNQGLAGLEAIGYDAADAQVVLSMVSYMDTVAGCFFGTVQQGGSGGTGAALFNFSNALAPLYAGQ